MVTVIFRLFEGNAGTVPVNLNITMCIVLETSPWIGHSGPIQHVRLDHSQYHLLAASMEPAGQRQALTPFSSEETKNKQE